MIQRRGPELLCVVAVKPESEEVSPADEGMPSTGAGWRETLRSNGSGCGVHLGSCVMDRRWCRMHDGRLSYDSIQVPEARNRVAGKLLMHSDVRGTPELPMKLSVGKIEACFCRCGEHLRHSNEARLLTWSCASIGCVERSSPEQTWRSSSNPQISSCVRPRIQKFALFVRARRVRVGPGGGDIADAASIAHEEDEVPVARKNRTYWATQTKARGDTATTIRTSSVQ